MKSINNGKWKEQEVKELFSTVEECKRKGQPISNAFSAHALKYSRRCNSVRNYYYAELASLYEDAARVKALNINLSNHTKQVFVEFDKEEAYALIKRVICNMAKGKSVRATCLELSGGNIEKMIRYQNKYRSALKSNVDLINEVMHDLDAKGTPYVNPLKEENPQEAVGANVLQMPKLKSKITDADISGLFFGIIRLIRKTTEEEISSKLKSECEFANSTLRKTLVTLNEKDKLIRNLSSTNSELKGKVGDLTKRLNEYRAGSYSLKSELERIKNSGKRKIEVIDTV